MPGKVKEERLATKGHGNQGWGWVGECSDEIVSCLDDIGGYITVCICQNLQNLTKIVSVLQAFPWEKNCVNLV